MNAAGLLHLRAAPYEVLLHGKHTWLLPLIERVAARTVRAEVDVFCTGPAAAAFVADHRPELKPGTSLHIELLDIHARADRMFAFAEIPPRIAPRAGAAVTPTTSPATEGTP